jgi:chloramphenicol-sensitive protein RarD
MPGRKMTEGRKGVAAIAAASAIWGLSSIYYKALAAVPPLEVLSHRTVWTVAFFAVVLAVQGRGAEVVELLGRPRAWRILAASGAMIALNWLVFIHAVQVGHALEASLGYYVFPLLAVALGYLALGERFAPLQAAAIGIAALAVAILGAGLGAPPWTALILASSFGAYGLVKRRVRLSPVVSVFIETLLLAPLALACLWGLHAGAWTDLGGRSGGLFGRDLWTSAGLACAGPLTGVPLMLFSYAARRIPYATLGLVQYLNPTLQFAVAVALFGEPFTPWHAIAFALIWSALALYSWQSWRGARRAPSAAVRPKGGRGGQ